MKVEEFDLSLEVPTKEITLKLTDTEIRAMIRYHAERVRDYAMGTHNNREYYETSLKEFKHSISQLVALKEHAPGQIWTENIIKRNGKTGSDDEEDDFDDFLE